MRLSFVGAAAALAVVLTFEAREAFACGGCFVPPASSTVVTGHRMALAVSPKQTVLWDQIQYAGDPAEFAWVLPVARGAVIETSTAAWFEVLEATTQRSITGPTLQCPFRSGGGCGAFASSAEDGSGGGAASGEPTVNVLHAGTVGPYETVTLATDVPGALNQWLVDHNFNVDPSTQPIIDDYVVEGFDFIALRLQPGQGVKQMTPVRVVTPGAGLSLPLRMVAIGTGAEVPIVLYVIGEGRYETQNFPTASLDTGALVWDFATNTSNYAEVRDEALAAKGGRSWLTTFSRSNAFLTAGGVDYDYDTYRSPRDLFDLYFSQAIANEETSSSTCKPKRPPLLPMVGDCADACDPSTTDVRTISCEGADDIARAFVGQHPGSVWLTRMEANLPQKALDTDLVLKAASRQDEEVERDVRVIEWENGGDACFGSAPPVVLSLRRLVDDQAPSTAWFPVLVAAAGLGLLARRLATRPQAKNGA